MKLSFAYSKRRLAVSQKEECAFSDRDAAGIMSCLARVASNFSTVILLP